MARSSSHRTGSYRAEGTEHRARRMVASYAYAYILYSTRSRSLFWILFVCRQAIYEHIWSDVCLRDSISSWIPRYAMQCNATQFLKRFSFRSYMGNGKCGQNSRTTYNIQTDRSVSNYDGCSRCVSRAHPYVSAWLSRFTCSYTSIYQGSTIS